MDNIFVERIDRDSFQTLCFMLTDAIRGYFRGDNATSIIVLAHSCRTVIQDLGNYHKKEGHIERIKWPSTEILSGKGMPQEKFLRNIANNLRHADKNSNGVIPTSFLIAHASLVLTILDFLVLKDALLERDIIVKREVKSFHDLGLSAGFLSVPKRIGPFHKIGPFQLGERPMNAREEEEYFQDWVPIVDQLSQLMIAWHMATQPNIEMKQLQRPHLRGFKLPEEIQEKIDRARFFLTNHESDKLSALSPVAAESYIASFIRVKLRSNVTHMNTKPFVVESQLSEYYTLKVELLFDGEIREVETVPTYAKPNMPPSDSLPVLIIDRVEKLTAFEFGIK